MQIPSAETENGCKEHWLQNNVSELQHFAIFAVDDTFQPQDSPCLIV